MCLKKWYVQMYIKYVSIVRVCRRAPDFSDVRGEEVLRVGGAEEVVTNNKIAGPYHKA